MSTEVLVPPLGQTIDTLTLVSWYKSEGDTVQHGEPLYAVETDKATLDVEAPATGVLRRVTANPGDVVKVLSAIAVIEDKDEAKVNVEEDLASALTSTSSRLFVSPRARRLAEAEGIALAAVKATGPQGAIVERDVRAYLQETGDRNQETGVSGQEAATNEVRSVSGNITPVARRIAEKAGLDWRQIPGTGPRSQITREDVEAALERRSERQRMETDKRMDVAASTVPSSFQLRASTPAPQAVPISGIRALIAERMVAGHNQTAPVTLTAEVDATALVELRRQLAADGVAVSYNDLFLTILGKALAEHPRLNASLDGEATPGTAGRTVKLWSQIDIGLAVDTERGLLAPVVRAVNRKGLAQLAAETTALAERARGGKCTPDELTGSTFTLTNLGMYGIDAFTPIINLPECAIMGVGRIKTQPVWAGDHVEPREMVWLSLTFDHRLVDGGPAARFLKRVAQLVEKPHLLMS